MPRIAWPAVGERRRQDADRPELAHRAGLDRAQQHLGVGREAEHEGRRRVGHLRPVQDARVAEVAVDDPRPGEEAHLQDPVERNRDLAEEEGAVESRRQQDVVEHQQRQRQHRGGAHDVVEVRERGEAPLGLVQVEQEIDDRRIDEEAGQHGNKPVEALVQAARLRTGYRSSPRSRLPWRRGRAPRSATAAV